MREGGAFFFFFNLNFTGTSFKVPTNNYLGSTLTKIKIFVQWHLKYQNQYGLIRPLHK